MKDHDHKNRKAKRSIIKINEDLCDGCGQCVVACAEGAIEIIDGKAKLVADNLCDGLGACIGECPTGALEILEREADEFDLESVHQKKKKAVIMPSRPCCPSSQIMTMQAAKPADRGIAGAPLPSMLSTWPVQISLIPPTAPFLQDADLLVAADCVPFAYAGFHNDFLRGKTLMVGCPKLDDAEEYREKFTEIFRKNRIRSVTVVRMEVPCCSYLPRIVALAMEEAGKQIPIDEVVITRQGGKQ
jgi:ferredoxin